MESLQKREAELYKNFCIINLWDAKHSLDQVVCKFLAQYEIFVIDRISGTSQWGDAVVRFLKHIEITSTTIPLISRSDIGGSPYLREAITNITKVPIPQSKLTNSEKSTQTGSSPVMETTGEMAWRFKAEEFEKEAQAKAQQAEEAATRIQEIDQPEVTAAQQTEEIMSPTPNSEETDAAMTEAEKVAAEVIADSFLNLAQEETVHIPQTDGPVSVPESSGSTSVHDKTTSASLAQSKQTDMATEGEKKQAEAYIYTLEEVLKTYVFDDEAQMAKQVVDEVTQTEEVPVFEEHPQAHQVPTSPEKVPASPEKLQDQQGDPQAETEKAQTPVSTDPTSPFPSEPPTSSAQASESKKRKVITGPIIHLEVEEIEREPAQQERQPVHLEGTDPAITEEIREWAMIKLGTTAFVPSGHIHIDVQNLIRIVAEQAQTIEEQKHEIRGIKLYCSQQSQAIESWKKEMTANQERMDKKLGALMRSWDKYIDTDIPSIIKTKAQCDTLKDLLLAQRNHMELMYNELDLRIQSLALTSAKSQTIINQAFQPYKGRIESLEAKVAELDSLKASMLDVLHTLDDAKKGESSKKLELTVEERMELLQKEFQQAPQVSEEYRQPGKRKRTDQSDDQPISKKKLQMEPEKKVQAHAVRSEEELRRMRAIREKFYPDQHLEVFAKAGILKSHGTEFPWIDKWVPEELNAWWEKQREIFLKWYYNFAVFNAKKVSQSEAWFYFLCMNRAQDKVNMIKEAARKTGSREIRYPTLKTFKPPKTDQNKVDVQKIEEEARILIKIFHLDTPATKESALQTRKALFRSYGVAVPKP